MIRGKRCRGLSLLSNYVTINNNNNNNNNNNINNNNNNNNNNDNIGDKVNYIKNYMSKTPNNLS